MQAMTVKDTPTQLQVLAVLQEMDQPSHFAFPAKRIAARAGLSTAQVAAALALLRSRGLVRSGRWGGLLSAAQTLRWQLTEAGRETKIQGT